MSTKMLFSAIAIWLAVVTVIAVMSLWAGFPMTVGTGVLILMAGIVPPAIVFRAFGGPAEQTVSEMLRK